MVSLATSTHELGILLQITDDLTKMPDSPVCLDEIINRIHSLIPFEKCVLFHERALDPDAGTSIFEFASTGSGCRTRTFEGRQALKIDHYVRCLQSERVDGIQHAFFWRSAPDDRQVPGFLQQTGLQHGVAGYISSVDNKASDGVTLIQLQYSPGHFAHEHLMFVNFIVLYLHLYFGRCHAGFDSWSARHNLTGKEKEVLQWAVEGKTSTDIGKILSMSERTVKFHLGNIYAKLNVINRTQAVTLVSRAR